MEISSNVLLMIKNVLAIVFMSFFILKFLKKPTLVSLMKKTIPKKECVLAGGCNVNSLQIKRKRTGMNLASVSDLERGVFCIDKIENSETGRAKICYGSANNLNLASVEQINHKIAI